MTSNCSTALPRSSEFCQIVRIPNDDHDDDNYDCRFVERPNIHGKAMPVALTGEVSLPDKYTKHRQREGWWCSHWFENSLTASPASALSFQYISLCSSLVVDRHLVWPTLTTWQTKEHEPTNDIRIQSITMKFARFHVQQESFQKISFDLCKTFVMVH